MQKAIITICDSGYEKYTDKFVKSAITHGWDQRILVLQPHKTEYRSDNDNVKIVTVEQKYKNKYFSDARWLKMQMRDEVIRLHEGIDRALYCDSDQVFRKSPDEIFNSCPDHYGIFCEKFKFDNVADNTALNDILGTHYGEQRWCDGNMVFDVDSFSSMRFFDAYKLASRATEPYRGGTMSALQIAVHMTQAMTELEPSMFCTTYEKKLGMKKEEDCVLYHYAGRIGKEEWRKTYGN